MSSVLLDPPTGVTCGFTRRADTESEYHTLFYSFRSVYGHTINGAAIVHLQDSCRSVLFWIIISYSMLGINGEARWGCPFEIMTA